MNNLDLIQIANQILHSTDDPMDSQALNAEACEFLRVYGGKNNQFLATLNRVSYVNRAERFNGVKRILQGYIRYLEKGLSSSLSPERQTQIETVGDFLSQAEDILSQAKLHNAVAVVLIGASLEEFLRGWCEAEQLKPQQLSIDGYMKALKDEDLINKQDIKDITGWAGLRNDAAHGHWDKVSDYSRADIMLKGVRLFIQSYSK